MSDPVIELIIIVNCEQFWFDVLPSRQCARLTIVSTFPKEARAARQSESVTAGGLLASILPPGWTVNTDGYWWTMDGQPGWEATI